MSLFSVLRYPISTWPTSEELTALPPDLFSAWKLQTTWKTPYNHQTPELIAVFYEMRSGREAARDFDEIQLLKQMIKDYDEPI